jgi:two-component sensor histidine kinase
VPVALILNELLLNAVKHRSDPAAAVRVSLRKGDAADRVRVTISNAGTWRAPSEGQIGLSLVDSLMPRSGARLTRGQQTGVVHSALELGPPVISLLSGVLV